MRNLTSMGTSSAMWPSNVNIFCSDAAAVCKTCFTTSLGRNFVASNFITPEEELDNFFFQDNQVNQCVCIVNYY